MTPKWLLSRRTALRGSGAAIGLPLLDAMIAPRRARAQTAPKRFFVYYRPGGTVMSAWRMTGGPTSITLNTIQAPLEPWKAKVIGFDGLDLKITSIGNGHPHSKGMGGLLTGRELPPGPYETCGGRAGLPTGPSIDQVVAGKIGAATRFRSIEVAVNWPTDRRDGGKVAPTNCIIYAGAPGASGQGVPPQIDPKAVWDRLFMNLGDTSQVANLARLRDKSILDGVMKEYQSISARVGREDRAKLDAHLTKVREIEASINALPPATTSACTKPSAPAPLGDPDNGLVGEPGSNQQKNPQLDARMPELGKAMMDMLVMAATCDLARVGTMQWVDSQSYNTFPFLNLLQGHHGYQHDNGFQPGPLTTIETWYASQLAYFVRQLSSVQEMGKTLFDSTAILYVTEISTPDSHAQANMPFLMVGDAGGAFKTGQVVRASGVSHNNLLVSILNGYGVPDAKFGNPTFSTGTLPILA